MIPMLVGEGGAEAQRIQAGLMDAGINAKLIDDIDALIDSEERVALVQADALNKLPKVPNLGAIIAFGGEDRAQAAIRCIRHGASEYLPAGAGIELVSSSIRALQSTPENTGVIARSPRMLELLALAKRVAQADIAVMVSGESGTGKEVIARHIHNSSARKNGPFVAVNCAAIPETMLEAVLFGHEKGAFTGASEKRLGKFELAHGGTLLLDEITEMPVGLQAKLLRVLQEREVERIGSNKTHQVDVRVVATSNRNLQAAVKEGVLREDLYYRLCVFPLHLAPLRERHDDIVALANFFLDKHAGAGVKPVLTSAAASKLEQYNWPGNVRELENCIQRALVLRSHQQIEVEDLALSMPVQESDTQIDSLHKQLRSSEEELLLQTLAENQGVRKATAVQLGISERTLRYKLKQLRDRGVAV